MSDKQERNEKTRQQHLHNQQRAALSDAYAQLEGEKVAQTFNAFSFEEALDNQIERIKGTSTKIRPNELDKVESIYLNLKKTVEQVKQVPPETFLTPNEATDVNTPEDGTDPNEQAIQDATTRKDGQDSQ